MALEAQSAQSQETLSNTAAQAGNQQGRRGVVMEKGLDGGEAAVDCHSPRRCRNASENVSAQS
jgi:hypothetical protein